MSDLTDRLRAGADLIARLPGDDPYTVPLLREAADGIEEAVALLREVQESGVSWEAKGKYRETQIDATTSDAIFAFLARTG